MIKKILTVAFLCASTFSFAQIINKPFQTKVSFHPDPDNISGCQITVDDTRNEMRETGLMIGFNMMQVSGTEDVNYYLFGIAPDAQLTFINKEILVAILDNTKTDPLQIDGILMLNNRTINCMFSVIKKKEKSGQIVSELTYAIPYQAIGYNKEGSVTMIIKIRSY